MPNEFVNIRVVTTENRLLAAIKAERVWRPIDVKDGIRYQTTIRTVQQRLFYEDQELPDKTQLDSLVPPDVEEVQFVFIRRPQEQADWIERCMEYGQQLRLAPPEFQADRDVVLAAVKRSWKALQFASEELQSDLEIATTALDQDLKAADFIGQSLWEDRIFVLFAVQKDWQYLELCSDKLLADPEIVLAAVQGHWEAIFWADPGAWDFIEVPRVAARQGGWEVHDRAPLPRIQAALKADKEFVMTCISHDWNCLRHVNQELLDDPEVGRAAVHKDWRALRYLSRDLQFDRQIVESMVKQTMCCLTLALEEIPIERELVIELVKRNWQVVAHLSFDLRNDPGIALAAVTNDWKSLEYLPDERRNDPELIIEAAKQDPKAVLLGGPQLFRHKKVVQMAIAQDGMFLKLASDELRDNIEIVLKSVLQNWRALQFASERVRTDQQVVWAAFIQDLTAMDFATPALLSNGEVMKRFLLHNQDVLPYISVELFEQRAFVEAVAADPKLGKEVIMKFCRKNWKCLAVCPDKFKYDKKVILAALETDWQPLNIIQDVIDPWNDAALIRAAVKHNQNLMKEVNSDLWTHKDVVLIAVQQGYEILEEAPDFQKSRLWNDEPIVLECIRQNPMNVRHMNKKLWNDQDVVMHALKQDWKIMELCPQVVAKEYWKERDIVIEAVKQSINALKHMAKEFWEDDEILKIAALQDYTILDNSLIPMVKAQNAWADRDIVLAAVKTDGMALKYASDVFLEDYEIVREAISNDIEVMDNVNKYYSQKWWNTPEYVKLALQKDVANFEKCGESIRENKEVVLALVTQRGMSLANASRALKCDKHVVLAAVTQDGLALEYASASLKADYDIVTAAITQNGAALDLAAEALQADEHLVDLAGIA
eukprot:TRINITY_DN80004_c0_g1_i1.p1 TRINITY_DN80004_c0_g1~~TRINITY_DN80004_c0_g1_i1.p1  ORF type:complete len:884 (+),score=185.80 TRINITY_DN80004_c0_g1_i1:95-2746(+)